MANKYFLDGLLYISVFVRTSEPLLFAFDFYVFLMGNKNEIMCATDCGSTHPVLATILNLCIENILWIWFACLRFVSHSKRQIKKQKHPHNIENICGFWFLGRKTFDFIRLQVNWFVMSHPKSPISTTAIGERLKFN